MRRSRVEVYESVTCGGSTHAPIILWRGGGANRVARLNKFALQGSYLVIECWGVYFLILFKFGSCATFLHTVCMVFTQLSKLMRKNKIDSPTELKFELLSVPRDTIMNVHSYTYYM
jgi:hypothetical protein